MRNNSIYYPKKDNSQKSFLYTFKVGYLSLNSLYYNMWILTISGKFLDIMTNKPVSLYLFGKLGVIHRKFPHNAVRSQTLQSYKSLHHSRAQALRPYSSLPHSFTPTLPFGKPLRVYEKPLRVYTPSLLHSLTPSTNRSISDSVVK